MIFGEFATLEESELLLNNTILTGFIQRRVDYFFISNSFQESITTTDASAAFSIDHSLITLSLCHLKESL